MRALSYAAVAVLALSAATSHAALLSADAGEIREVMITVPPDDFDQQARISILASDTLSMIARALDARVEVLVHAYPAHRAAIESVLRRAGVTRMRFVPSAYGHYTRWARDMFLVTGGDAGHTWLLPQQILRRLDDSVAAEVAATIGQRTKQLPLSVEGGNLIAFGDWVFAGKDLLLNGPDSIDVARRETLQRSLAPDSNWTWIGNQDPHPHGTGVGIFQPLFHIDMFVTAVAGDTGVRPQLIVGSIASAEKLIGEAGPAVVSKRLDDVADQLRHAGFKVTRMPLLMRYDGDVVTLVSYNNVLFDGADGRTVIMPQYAQADASLQRLDAFAVEHFQRLGYTPRLVHGPLLDLGRQLGGLRCLIQVTGRQ